MATFRRSRGFSGPTSGGECNHTENLGTFLRFLLYASESSAEPCRCATDVIDSQDRSIASYSHSIFSKYAITLWCSSQYGCPGWPHRRSGVVREARKSHWQVIADAP